MSIFCKKLKETVPRFIHSSFLKVTGIYTVANFANAAIPFLLMPILTRCLTPNDYGITAIFGVLLGICTPFIGLNTQFAISLKYFKIKEAQFSKYVSSCLLITLVSCFVVTMLIIFFNSEIEKISNFPSEWLWSIVIVCFSASIISTLFNIFRSAVKPYHYGIIQFLRTALNMALSIWFVVWLNMSWQGWVIAQVIAAVVFAFISIYLLYINRWLVFEYDLVFIKDALKFGVPLLPTNLAIFAMALADRFIITEVLGLTDVGIYFVGIQFGAVVGLIIGSFNGAFTPWLFNKLNTATEIVKSKIVLASYAYIIGMIVMAIGISWFMSFVITFWVDEKFFGAINVIFWACLAQVFNGLWIIVANYIFYVERTHMELWITIPTSIFHVILCFIMVRENGIIGAAQAATVTYFIKLLLGGVMSNKLYPMPWLSFYKNIYNPFSN